MLEGASSTLPHTYPFIHFVVYYCPSDVPADFISALVTSIEASSEESPWVTEDVIVQYEYWCSAEDGPLPIHINLTFSEPVIFLGVTVNTYVSNFDAYVTNFSINYFIDEESFTYEVDGQTRVSE